MTLKEQIDLAQEILCANFEERRVLDRVCDMARDMLALGESYKELKSVYDVPSDRSVTLRAVIKHDGLAADLAQKWGG